MIIITEGGSFSVFAIEVLSVFCINLRNTFAVFQFSTYSFLDS